MRWLPWLAGLLILVDLPLTLVVAPPAANFSAPLTQRIFYYHVPSAWVAYLAFAVTAGASGMVLWARQQRWDAVALASAEVGTVFSVVALATGLVWSRAEFGGAYSAFQDAKVITLVVVILAYLAYFALRRSVPEPGRRARLAAVYGILALLGVPLSYLASKASIHPDFLQPDQSLEPVLGWFLLYSTVAFTALFAALMDVRLRLARVEAAREDET